MNGIESAQHDLYDAQASVDTALQLLSSINGESRSVPGPELESVIQVLQAVLGELEQGIDNLDKLQLRSE